MKPALRRPFDSLFMKTAAASKIRPEPNGPARSGGNVRALPAGEGVSDGRLVERAKGGDRWAEEVIYRRYVQAIAGLVLRLLRDRQEMEDVVQETFALALERLGSLRDGEALRSWLSQIAVNQVRRRFRRRRLLSLFGFTRPGEDIPLEALAAEAPGGEVAAELAALDRVLQALPIEQRIAWMLRYAEGETLEEVARACSCSLATAKRRIAAADARVSLHVRLT